MGFYLLSELSLAIIDSLIAEYKQILPVFVSGMQDPSSSVRVLALRGFSIFSAGVLQSEAIDELSSTIPVVMKCLKDCLAQGEEQVTVDALDTLSELVLIDAKLVEEHLSNLCETLTDCIASPDIMSPPKVSASEVLKTLIEQFPRKLSKLGYITKLIPMLMKISAQNSTDPNLETEPTGEYLGGIHHTGEKAAEADDEDEDDSVKVINLCGRLLDTIALNCSANKVWKCVSGACSACLQSSDWRQRRTALVTMAMSAEGCREIILETLGPIVGSTCQSTSDSVAAVREAAFWALGQYAEQLMPHVAQHYREMLPPLLQGVKDTNHRVAEKAMFALEAYAENLDQEVIVHYMQQILQTLFAALNTPVLSMQGYAISALASVAISAKEAFQPYFTHVIPTLISYVREEDENKSSIRSKAIDCLGHVCAAVGKEYFDSLRQQGHDILALVSQASAAEDMEVQESVYSFFGQIASVLKHDFAPVMDKLYDSLMQTACSSDGIETSSRFMRDDDGITDKFLENDDEEEDLEEENHVLTSFHAHTGVLELKETAVATLGMCAHNMGSAFKPWAQQTYSILTDNLLHHHHEPIRQHAVSALQYVVESMYYADGGQSMGQECKTICDNTITELTSLLVNEDDMEVCGRICDALKFLCDVSNGTMVEPHVKSINDQLLILLNGEAACQEDADEDSDDEQEGTKSQGQILIDSIIELVASFAKIFGSNYSDMFAALYPRFLELARKKTSGLDRAMAIGIFAEILEYFGGDLFGSRYREALQIMVEGISDESPLVKRNSLFGIGKIAEHCPQLGEKLIQNYLPIIGNSTDPNQHTDRAVVENAAGALCRFIRVFWDKGAIDIGNYVHCLIRVLPVEDDLQENETIYSTLAFIIEKQPQLINSYAEQFIQAFVHDLAREERTKSLNPETKLKICQIIQNTPALANVASKLPSDKQESLASTLHSLQ